MLTTDDYLIIQIAKQAGCEIPALSKEPPEYWLGVAKSFLSEILDEKKINYTTQDDHD